MLRLIAALSMFLCSSIATNAETFSADVWADNWFEMRINGVQVAEDSVPITTERSFNAESFRFEADRPFVVGVVAKDFKENDTGLEYIGTRRQQMGDGGLILQIKNTSGELVAVSDGAWQCKTVHKAPLDKACEKESNPVAGEAACGFESNAEPAGWDKPGFDASTWPQANIYTEQQVRPRGGYNQIDWADAAKLIWGEDLEQSNTVLCRLEVN